MVSYLNEMVNYINYGCKILKIFQHNYFGANIYANMQYLPHKQKLFGIQCIKI